MRKRLVLIGSLAVAGLLYGNPKQLLIQAIAAAVIIAYDAVATYVVLRIVALFIPLRASDTEVEGGDLAIHGIDPVPMYMPAPALLAKPAATGGAPAD